MTKWPLQFWHGVKLDTRQRISNLDLRGHTLFGETKGFFVIFYFEWDELQLNNFNLLLFLNFRGDSYFFRSAQEPHCA